MVWHGVEGRGEHSKTWDLNAKHVLICRTADLWCRATTWSCWHYTSFPRHTLMRYAMEIIVWTPCGMKFGQLIWWSPVLRKLRGAVWGKRKIAARKLRTISVFASRPSGTNRDWVQAAQISSLVTLKHSLPNSQGRDCQGSAGGGQSSPSVLSSQHSSLPWEPGSTPASKEILEIVLTLKFYYHV